MKKVYLLSPKFSDYIGGMETHAIEFAKFFFKRNDFKLDKIFSQEIVNDGISAEKDVSIVSPNEMNVDGFSVKSILTGNFETDSEILLSEIEPDSILFLNSPTWLPVIKKIKPKLNLQVVVRSGGNDIPAGWVGNENSNETSISETRSELISLINVYADILICNSCFSKNNALKFGVNESKIQVISGGVDTSRFKESKKESPPIILTTGRFVNFKGLEFSLKAISELKKITSHSFKYLLIGSGPKKSDLEKQIHDLALTNVVSIIGPVDINKIQEYYNSATLFLHLPILELRDERGGSYVHTETMGRTICEAMASELPIVASKVGGIPEMMFDKRNGFLVSEKDYVLAAKKLNELLEDNVLRKQFSDFGRTFALKHYDWSLLFNKYIKLFEGEKHEDKSRCISSGETI